MRAWTRNNSIQLKLIDFVDVIAKGWGKGCLCNWRSLPVTWQRIQPRTKMPSKRKLLEMGGEKIGKKRSLKRQIRDTTRLLSKVSTSWLDLDPVLS